MRPDVTKAQIIAAAGAGVPILVSLLAAFGVFAPTPAERDAIEQATKWATVFAGLLVLGDAHLRGKRNEADAVVKAAQAKPPTLHTTENAHSDPGPAFTPSSLAGRPRCRGTLTPVDVQIDGKALAGEALEAAQPDGRYDVEVPDDEVDLDDPLIDDPHAGIENAGISRTALAAHYGNAATAEDLAEAGRDS